MAVYSTEQKLFLDLLNKAHQAVNRADLKTLQTIFSTISPETKKKLLTTLILDSGIIDATLLIHSILNIKNGAFLNSHLNHSQIATFLIAEMKKLNDPTIFNIRCSMGDTALHAAIEMKLEKIISLLVTSGANLTLTRDNGTTPLIMATIFELSPDTLTLLCEKEIINHQDREGNSALHYVTNLLSLKAILKAGPQVDLYNNKRFTPLHTIIGKTQQLGSTKTLAMVKSLVKAKCDITLRDGLGYPPLMQFKSDDALPIFEYLVSVGADINGRGSDGLSVLSNAIQAGLKGITFFILNHNDTNVDSNEIVSLSNQNYLHKAVLDNLPSSCKQLSFEEATRTLAQLNPALFLSLKDNPRFNKKVEMSPLKMALVHVKDKNYVLEVIAAYERKNILDNLRKLVLEQQFIHKAILLGSYPVIKKLMELIKDSPLYFQQIITNILAAAMYSNMETSVQDKTEFLEIIKWNLKILSEQRGMVTQADINEINKNKRIALQLAISFGSSKIVEALFQEGSLMTNETLFLFYIRLYLQTTHINSEFTNLEVLGYYSEFLKTWTTLFQPPKDSLNTCLEILPIILDLQISLLLNQEFGSRKSNRSINTLILFLTDSYRSLVPNLNGQLIISLSFRNRIAQLTINKNNIQMILKKIDELIEIKKDKALFRSITNFLLTLTEDFTKDKETCECRKLLDEHESLVLTAKSKTIAMFSHFENFTKESLKLKTKINETQLKCLQELASASGNWQDGFKEKCKQVETDIKTIEETFQQYSKEIKLLQDNAPFKIFEQQHPLIIQNFQQNKPHLMQNEIQKLKESIIAYEGSWLILKGKLDNNLTSLTNILDQLNKYLNNIQTTAAKERELATYTNNDNSSKQHKKKNISKRKKPNNKNKQKEGAGAGFVTTSAPIAQPLKFPSNNLLITSVSAFREKAKAQESLILQYQQTLSVKESQDNKRLNEFSAQQLLTSVRNIKATSSRATLGLSPSEFTLDMAGGISIYTRFHDECLVLESVLRELEQLDNNGKAPTLRQIITKRNTLLGISSRAMEIIKKLKIEYSPINPALAEHYRDVMAHADADKDLSLILELKSTIEDQQKHYQEIKTMVSLMLAYIRAYNNNSKDEAELCTQLYSNAQFQKIMRYKINNKPALAVCESMIALHQEELASLERKEISDTILSHALGFIEGRMGAFSAKIRELYPEVYNARAELQQFIKPGIDYRHAVNSTPHPTISRHFPEASPSPARNVLPLVFTDLTKQKKKSAGPGHFVVDESLDETTDDTANNLNNETPLGAKAVNEAGSGAGVKPAV